MRIMSKHHIGFRVTLQNDKSIDNWYFVREWWVNSKEEAVRWVDEFNKDSNTWKKVAVYFGESE